MLLKLIILKIRKICSGSPFTTKSLILPDLEVAMTHWEMPSAEQSLLAQGYMLSQGSLCIQQAANMGRERPASLPKGENAEELSWDDGC